MLNTVKVSAHLIILHTCLTRVQKFPEQCTFSACMLCTDHHFWSKYFTPSRLTNNWIFILLQWNHPSTQSPVYLVCDIDNMIEEPKNWLISKFINIKNATRLDIEVTYTFRNCPLGDVGPFCRTNFSLYSYHADYKFYPKPTPLNFHKETVITPKTLPAPGELATNIFYGSVVTEAKGIYLALLDQGACLTIREFVVRYHFCSETVPSKMVRFSRTFAPANDGNLTKQEGECADPNSITKNNEKLFGVCLSNGEWNITDNSACLCNYGYELTNGSFPCKG